MIRHLLLASSAFALLACSQAETPTASTETETTATETAEAVSNESAVLNAWFERRFEEEMMERPEFLTQMGRKDRQAEWNDGSKAAWLDQMDRTKADLDYLTTEIDVDALDHNTRLSHTLAVKNAEDQIEGMRWYGYFYPFNQMFGVHSGIPTFLMNQHKINNVEDAEAYIARLNSVDEKLGEMIDRSADSFERGIAPPKFVYAHILRDVENITSGAPFDDSEELTLLLKDFQTKVDALDIEEAERERLFTEAIEAMQNTVAPAYKRLVTELERQEALATTDDGAWKLPDGDEFYAYRLRMMTTTDLSADEIHNIGLREVDRIHAEMRDIMEKVDFEGDLQDFFEFMRTDEQFYYPNTDEGRQAYLDDATALIDTISERLPEMFKRLPKAELEVRRVEPFREKSAGKAFYNRPAPDGSRPGYYYANLYDMADMPNYQMEALAYHEGNPGHHMQIAIAQELEDVPSFRKFGGYTPYSEGWGLYSEYFPKEMGYYQDPYSDFGRLAMELWRACRLVVDTGLHAKQWTREEAIEYLKENTPNPEGDIVKAIERYIVMPGQATAYLIGKIKIMDLREKARTELGEDFDIRDFHDVVLANGAVPLDVLEAEVDRYIAETKAG